MENKLKSIFDLFKGVLIDSCIELDLNNEDFEIIKQKQDELIPHFKTLLSKKLKEMVSVGSYLDEEVNSDFIQNKNFKYRSLLEQKNVLEKYFGPLGKIDSVYPGKKYPDQSNLYLIPNIELAGDNFEVAMDNVLRIIAKESGRPVTNSFISRRMKINELVHSKNFLSKIDTLKKSQNGENSLVIPAQLGIRHKGRSGRRADECMTQHEFGLDPYQLGIILITHPERAIEFEDGLAAMCTGMVSKDGELSPYFSDLGHGVNFNLIFRSITSRRSSVPSGFVLN